MNTLGKSITSTFFKTPDDYVRLKQFWSQKMRAREKLPSSHHGLYLILIGRNWLKGFSLPKTIKDPASTSPVLLARRLRWYRHTAQEGKGPFGFFLEFISDEGIDRILQHLPEGDEIQNWVSDGKEIQPYKIPTAAAGKQNAQ